MEKLLFIILLSILLNAQSPKDNLLGHYVGIERHIEYPGGTILFTCASIYNLKADTNYPVIIVEDTSCSQFEPVYDSYTVMDDSAIWSNWTESFQGRLFSNDSLYLSRWSGLGDAVTIEFFGFKQYGFPTPIGIKELHKENSDILLYPNPNNGSFNLASKDGESISGSLEIMDVLGSIKYRQEVRDENAAFIDLKKEQINPGIYFVKFYDSKANPSFTSNIIVQ